MYHKHGKIRWAKHLSFQPYEVFCRSNFAVHWPLVFIAYLYLKIHGKTHSTLKNPENHESLAQRIFPRLRYVFVTGLDKSQLHAHNSIALFTITGYLY